MQYLKNIIIAITILLGLITFAQSETSWIKKKDKTETIKKVEKEKTTSWIKKKEVKENKKKLKEKIKESKSWITKKSKEKEKDIKNKLKKHKSIKDLPKAEVYFTAIIQPIEQKDKPIYFYGYVNSNKKSKSFKFKDQSYYSKSDGIAYFENKKYSCQVDSKITPLSTALSGDVIVECKKNKKMSGAFIQIGSEGQGMGEHWDGNKVEFKFFNSKSEAIAKLEDYKKSEVMIAKAHSSPDVAGTNRKIDLKPAGKYYALLIGNSNYLKSSGWGPLISPTNDITEIAKVLRTNYDFADVKVIKDVTRDKLFKTLRNYQKIITPNDYFLIYYAGHGDQDANQAYWIPVNAGKEWDENWIDTLTIKAAISRIKTKHTLLMIDSCYVGTSLKGNDNNVSKNYKVSTKLVEKGLLNRAGIVISSGSTSSVLDTAIDDKHSPFAYKFIDLLKKNTSFITSTKLYSELVEYHEDFKQTPQRYTVKEWGHLDGDFVFIRK